MLKKTNKLLDVLPLQELELCEDVREHIELLKKQLTRNKLSVELQMKQWGRRSLSLLKSFEVGRILDSAELKELFLVKTGIQNVKCISDELMKNRARLSHSFDITGSCYLDSSWRKNRQIFATTSKKLLQSCCKVQELCSLAKTAKENCAYIVKAGGITRLQKLLFISVSSHTNEFYNNNNVLIYAGK